MHPSVCRKACQRNKHCRGYLIYKSRGKKRCWHKHHACNAAQRSSLKRAMWCEKKIQKHKKSRSPKRKPKKRKSIYKQRKPTIRKSRKPKFKKRKAAKTSKFIQWSIFIVETLNAWLIIKSISLLKEPIVPGAVRDFSLFTFIVILYYISPLTWLPLKRITLTLVMSCTECNLSFSFFSRNDEIHGVIPSTKSLF